MKWVEIPAIRVLEVMHIELLREFDLYDEEGRDLFPDRAHLATGQLVGLFPALGHRAYRIVRRSDGKVFRWQKFWTMDPNSHTFYLEEI